MNRLIRVSLVVFAVAALSLAGCVSHPAATIRVLTYNIHHGEGMDGQIDIERIAQVIRQTKADLVALQEVDRGVERSNRVDQAARLAERTGLHAVFEKNIDCQGGEYGNAVLSRLPVERYQNHRLPKFRTNEQRGLLEVHVRAAGQELVFFATHLDHGPDDGERIASVARLRDLVEQQGDTPVIVAGDLNAVPDSRVLAEAMAFLVGASADGREVEVTYPADRPDRRIDYVLYNRRPVLKCVELRVIPEPVASDHRPVLAVFTVATDCPAAPPRPRIPAGDERSAVRRAGSLGGN